MTDDELDEIERFATIEDQPWLPWPFAWLCNACAPPAQFEPDIAGPRNAPCAACGRTSDALRPRTAEQLAAALGAFVGAAARTARTLRAAERLAAARLAWLDMDDEIAACSACDEVQAHAPVCEEHRRRNRELGQAMDAASDEYRKAKHGP